MGKSRQAVLLFIEGENIGSEIRVNPPQELIIGRSEQCEVFIGEKKVSRRHAKLTANAEGFFIEDMQSTNGTFVDGKKVTGVKLRDGQEVRIGMTVFRITIKEGIEEISVSSDEGEGPEPFHDSSSVEIPMPRTAELDPGESSSPKHLPSIEEAMTDDLLEEDYEAQEEPSLKEERIEKRAARKGEKKKPLSGNISEMALPDLLQMLKNNRRSGVLSLNAKDETARIYFIEGRLKGAELGKAKGIKVVYRLLSLTEGDFEFESLPDGFSEDSLQEKIEMSMENILIEGMRQMDELEKIKKELPALNARLEMNKECGHPLSRLHPKVLDILQLVLKLGRFEDVMNESRLSDLETGKIVYYLLKKEYINSRK